MRKIMRLNKYYWSLSNIKINGKVFYNKKSQKLIGYNLEAFGPKRLSLRTFIKKFVDNKFRNLKGLKS